MLHFSPRACGLAALALGLSFLAGCGQGPPALSPPEPPAVAVVHPELRPFTEYKEFIGRLETKDPVTVQPQVTGILLKREYQDGDPVEKDKTVLYQIDPVLYKADLEQAKADVLKANADVKNWTAQIAREKAELTRVELQLKGGAGIPADKDKAVANLAYAEAQHEVAKASVEIAKAKQTKAQQNLDYCTIWAPTNGKIGESQVAPGNVVTAYQTKLAEIYPTDPIYLIWQVDEQTSLEYRAEHRRRVELKGAPKDEKAGVKILFLLKNETDFKEVAKDPARVSTLDFVDPEFVRGTGTITLRSTFDNSKGLLTAGSSARVRAEIGSAEPKLMIPETVVMTQARSKYVYVLNSQDEAEMRVVQLGNAADGWVVVESGLTPSDRVVANNLLRVRPGVKVKVVEGK
jgi:RND family efflux transporter MFP subunit